MKRKIGNLIMMSAVALICLLLLPTEAKAASVEDLTFQLNSDGRSYCVYSSATTISGDLIIPATYNNLPVTSVRYQAFSNRSSLTSITIPASVTTIGDYAFSRCTSLNSVTILDGVASIGSYAFNGCTNLTSVTIPNSVTTIGSYAFYGCTNLTSATIPNNVTIIGSHTFYECASLSIVIIGNGVTSIGDYAFTRCTSLTSVVIPDNVTSIGNYVFLECNNLANATIGNGVTYIGEKAFNGCKNLTSITIPNSVTDIGSGAFQSCSRLSNVTIGNSVTSIGISVFRLCTSLTSVTIPNSVTSIGINAFYYCTNLTEVTVPDSVININASAFESCESLTDVYYTGTQEQWNAIIIGQANSALQSATLHFVVPCTDNHIFDNAEDASCNNCNYTRLVADSVTLDVGNKLVVEDNEASNQHHRAVVYFLGEQTVADITDEAALKAIDADAKTHWGLASINKVQLKDNGNYVVHIHYNEGTGAKQTVAKAFTVNIVKPVIEMNGHKVMVTAGDSSCINYRATVYYLGEKAVNNITDEAALKTNAESAKTYWGLTDINKVQLLNNGNYVILLHYNIGTGAKQTVAKTVTVDRSEPTLNVANGKIVASDLNNAFLHHRAVVYYLGEGTSIEDAVSTKTYWTLSTINKVNLTQPGNYVILLHYNLADSVKMTVTAQVTI